MKDLTPGFARGIRPRGSFVQVPRGGSPLRHHAAWSTRRQKPSAALTMLNVPTDVLIPDATQPMQHWPTHRQGQKKRAGEAGLSAPEGDCSTFDQPL